MDHTADHSAFLIRAPCPEDSARPLGATGLTVTPIGLAVLARPWVAVVLSGAATPVRLAANLRALGVVCESGLEQDLSPIVEAPADYWATRGALAWN